MSSGHGKIKQLQVVHEPLLVLQLWARPDHSWSRTGVGEQNSVRLQAPVSQGNATLSSSPCRYAGS